MPEIETDPQPSYAYLMFTQWSCKFEKLMRNRLVMGAIRYGVIHKKDKKIYDRLESIEKRVNLYRQTGNDELLADIANLALLEFEEGIHPKKHFKAEDDKNHVNTN